MSVSPEAQVSGSSEIERQVFVSGGSFGSEVALSIDGMDPQGAAIVQQVQLGLSSDTGALAVDAKGNAIQLEGKQTTPPSDEPSQPI